jgi:hypothetical protein
VGDEGDVGGIDGFDGGLHPSGHESLGLRADRVVVLIDLRGVGGDVVMGQEVVRVGTVEEDDGQVGVTFQLGQADYPG